MPNKFWAPNHARPFVGVFKCCLKIFCGKPGDFCGDLKNKMQTAPRTGTGYPHACPFEGTPCSLQQEPFYRFRGGLVFKAHRLVYNSTLGLRVKNKKKKVIRATVDRIRQASYHGVTKSVMISTRERRSQPAPVARDLIAAGIHDK